MENKKKLFTDPRWTMPIGGVVIDEYSDIPDNYKKSAKKVKDRMLKEGKISQKEYDDLMNNWYKSF